MATIIKELELINNYRNTVKTLTDKIKAYRTQKKTTIKPVGKFLKVINYTELDNWNVKELLESESGSKTLIALADKIEYIALRLNDEKSISVLLNAILKGKKKIQDKSISQYFYVNEKNKLINCKRKESHFRWNFGTYTLNDNELNYLRELLTN